MNEQEAIKLAEQYCLNELDEAARNVVKERAKEDPLFHQLIEDTKILLAGLQEVARNELKKEMSQWERTQSLASEKKVVAWKTWAVIGVAASLTLGVSFFFWQQDKPSDSIVLFNQYYELYPNVVRPTVRGVQTDSSDLAGAYRLYDLREFEKAVHLFATLHEKDESILFYMGQCQFALGNTDLAIASFTECLAADKAFAEQAQWYLSLSYLKNGDAILAKEALEKVVNQNGSYRLKAERLLKQF